MDIIQASQSALQPSPPSSMRSENIGKLALALSKAQGLIRGAVKDSQNAYYKSFYADLESMQEAAREPLASNELAVIQTPDYFIEGELYWVIIFTWLIHSSGEYICSRLAILASRKANKTDGTDVIPSRDALAIKAAVTNARTISYAAIINLAQVDQEDNGQNKQGQSQHQNNSQSHSRESAQKPPANQQSSNQQSQSNGTGKETTATEDKSPKLRKQINEKLGEMHGGDVSAMDAFLKAIELPDGTKPSLSSLEMFEVSALAAILNQIMKSYNAWKKAA